MTQEIDTVGQLNAVADTVLSGSHVDPLVILITGEERHGKSEWCENLVQQARQRGMSVKGIYSPPVIEGGKKIGIDLINIQTGERRRLARARTENPDGIVTKNWQFNGAALAWGNEVLAESNDADILVIDEMGPLEFTHSTGLQTGIELVEKQNFRRAAFVVIGLRAIDSVKKRWPHAQVVQFSETT